MKRVTIQFFAIAFMWLCAVVASAATYCGEVITSVNGKHTATITCSSLGNNHYQFIFESTDAFNSYNAAGSNFYMNVNGVGGYHVSEKLAQDGNKLSVEIESTVAPTIYVGVFYVVYADGEASFNIPTDADFSQQCAGGDDPDAKDTEAPKMVSATLESYTYNSAVIEVSATDNVGVASYHVADAANSIDAKYTASEGNITVIGLTASTAYNFTITAFDLVGNESENSMSVAVTTPAHKTAPDALPSVPTYSANQVKAIYSATYSAECNFGDWGSGTAYTQDTYGKKFTTTASGYFGLVDFALNCASMESLHVDVWCEEDMTLRFVPIHGGTEVGVTKSVVGEQWNSIDIPLTDFAGVTDWSNVYQLKIDNVPSKTFWLNNIYFYTTVAPDEDTEAPTDFTASAVASYVSADITAQATDNSGAVIFQVFNGELQIATQNAASVKSTTFTVSGLDAGTAYTLTVKAVDESGNAAANVETLSFTTKALPAAATAPTAKVDDVQALYSDAYTPVTNRAMGQWSQTTKETEVTLAEGDKALLYTTCNYLGWELGATVDATDYPYFHMDIYVEEAGSIQFTPIWKNGEAVKTYDLAAGWNAFNIDLKADFAAIDLATIFQVKWAAMPTTCFIDNVYFYKQGKTTTIDATLSTSPAKKIIENGQLIITRDGVRYNAMGNRLQ